jgi:hypothetical protein
VKLKQAADLLKPTGCVCVKVDAACRVQLSQRAFGRLHPNSGPFSEGPCHTLNKQPLQCCKQTYIKTAIL